MWLANTTRVPYTATDRLASAWKRALREGGSLPRRVPPGQFAVTLSELSYDHANASPTRASRVALPFHCFLPWEYSFSSSFRATVNTFSGDMTPCSQEATTYNVWYASRPWASLATGWQGPSPTTPYGTAPGKRGVVQRTSYTQGSL